MIYAYKQIERATGRVISIIWYNSPVEQNDDPIIELVPIESQEEFESIIATFSSDDDEEEGETNV